jgi:SAM-dependent methyltransferase
MPAKRWTVERFHAESCYWRSCILLTAARLDLFELIGARGTTAMALSTRLGGKPAGWETFLNALCGMGLLRRRAQRYVNTAFSARYLKHQAAVRLWPDYDAFRAWAGLTSALRSTKRPKVQLPFQSNPKQAMQLLYSLDLDARQIAPHLLQKVRVPKSGRLLDVGGGLGAFSVAFCRRYPGLEATVVEHPKIVPLVRRAVRQAGMGGRIQVLGVDIVRQPLPRGFDIALLSNVLHAHGSNENRSLLRKLHDSLRPHGRLIVRDVFMRADGTAPEWGTLFSVLLFLHSPRGRCYSIDQIRAWVRMAGFSLIKRPFRSSPLSFDPDSVLVATA